VGDKGFSLDLPGPGGRQRRRRAHGHGLIAGRWGQRGAGQSFWGSLGAADQGALAARADKARFAAGAVLCQEGDEASADVFVIESGWVKISVEIGGREQIVAVRGRGEVVGERAGRTKGARSATVAALDEVRVLVVPGAWFTTFLAGHPGALRSVKRLEEEREAEDEARRWDAPEPDGMEWHLAELILNLARRCGWDERDGSAAITLPMSAAELASWANADAGAVVRCLRSWSGLGIVAASGPGMAVIVLARLRLCHAGAFLPMWRPPDRRPLWQALTDGAGGVFDLFG
jgi:CRP-like cAMP-binding protein